MIMRRLLMSTVICSGLVVAGEGAALASAPKAFAPNTSWAVSHVAARQGGSGDYCALARRFSGDMILTFARNAQDEGSVAIDFQKDTLKTADNYFVTLKPGFGQDRMFEVRPVSSKAMVIRMGQDSAFYDALARAETFKVDVSGQTYEFSVPDMDSGLMEMAGCVAALTQPAAGGSHDAAELSASEARVEKLLSAPVAATERVTERVGARATAAAVAAAPAFSDAEVKAATREIESLREENLRLKGAMENERRQFENRFMQQSSESSHAAELNEKLRLLELENQNLRSKLSAPQPAPAPVIAAPKIDPKTDERMRLLEAENQGLRQTIAENATKIAVAPAALQCDTTGADQARIASETLRVDLNTAREENARLKRQMADQTTRISSLETQVATTAVSAEAAARTTTQALVEQMRGQVAKLEEENAILRAKVRTRHVDATPGDGIATLTSLRMAEAHLQAITGERDRLAKQLEDINKGIRGDLLAKAAGNWNLEEATRRFNEAEREIRRLGGQIEQERAKCAADVKRIEYMMFDPAIASREQSAKLLKLEEQVMSFDAQAEMQNAAYKSRIQTLERTVAQKDDELKRVQSSIGAVQGQLAAKDNEIRDSRQKLVALEQNVTANSAGSREAQAQVALLQNTLNAKDAEVKSLRAELSGLQQRYAVLQQEVVTKESQFKVAQQNVDTVREEAKILRVRADEHSAKIVQQEQAQQARLIEAQQKIVRLNAEKETLAQQMTALRTQESQARTQEQKAVSVLSKERDDLRQRLAALETRNKEVEARSKEAVAEAASAKEAAEAAIRTAAIEAEAAKRAAALEAENARKMAAAQEAEKARQLVAAQAEAAKQEAAKQAAAQQAAADQARQLAAIAPAAGTAQGAPTALNAAEGIVQTAANNVVVPVAVSAGRVVPAASADAQTLRAQALAQVQGVQAQTVQQGQGVVAAAVQDGMIVAEQLAAPARDAQQLLQIPQDNNAQASQQPATPPQMAAAASAATQMHRLMNITALEGVLQQAGIHTQGRVNTVKSGPQMVAYSWESGALFGSAEQQPMGGLGQFDGLIQAYLEKTAQRCGGDFGAIPGNVEDRDGGRMAMFEIACIMPDGNGASAALVFHARDGLFTVVAHETSMEGMDIAMDARDAVYQALTQVRLAAR